MIVMDAARLMAEADHLSGVTPAMTAEQIRAQLISSTPAQQSVRYALDRYRETRNSAERALWLERANGHAAENASLRALIKHTLAGQVSSTSLSAPVGRPRRHQSDRQRKRDWARAARARRKAQGA